MLSVFSYVYWVLVHFWRNVCSFAYFSICLSLVDCYKEFFTYSLLSLHNSWHQSLLDLQYSSTMIVFSGEFSVQWLQKKGKENTHNEFIVFPQGPKPNKGVSPSLWCPSLEAPPLCGPNLDPSPGRSRQPAK